MGLRLPVTGRADEDFRTNNVLSQCCSLVFESNSPMAYQWGRFIWWLAQGNNATAIQAVAAILVALITAWYAILTHWIMKATKKQASAALQPVLALHRLARAEGETFHTILMQNSSDRPVVFLDVVISCYPRGKRPLVHKLRWWDDQILSARNDAKLRLDFIKELTAMGVREDECGYVADLVVSDLSRQVAIRYSYVWVLGSFSCKAGLPWRVWLRYKIRPWGWRYHRAKRWFSKK